MVKAVVASSLGAPADTYFYSLAQMGDILATIGSDDSLRLFDPSLTPIATARPNGSGLSCLQSFSNTAIATAGRDGIARIFDNRAKQVSQIQEPQGRPISAIASHQHILAIGTESTKEGLGDVSVLLYDTRKPSVPLRHYAESHTDSITQLAFHPQQPNVLLSGSTDGLVSLFDVDQAEEEDALQQVLNPRSAVHCAGFLTQDQAYVLTTDEHFLVYPLTEPIEGVEPQPATDFGDVRQKLNCMYVIDLVRQPDGTPVIAYGHNNDRKLALALLKGPEPWAFGDRVDLEGAHGEEVVRDVLVVEGRAYSCGEDGERYFTSVEKWPFRIN
ncbi:putative WD repeat-containing protein [Teratosphaeria destructans]|uniref:WD repeat-containing protein n=1 Tax=Teratosphaeria destructans TaxID=418781 RepID=A0A9W7VYP7_9PEZI|nr:putative WD repeat-containing protein [Teratosphaeria destructans]